MPTKTLLRRYAAVAIISAAGIAISLAAFASARANVAAVRRGEFQNEAAEATRLITEILTRSAGRIEALADSMKADPDQPEDEFLLYAELAMRRNDSFDAVSWSVWSTEPDGPPTNAPAGLHRLTVSGVYPADHDSEPIGADLAALPEYEAAILLARDTALPAATPPIATATPGSPAAVVFVPVYNSPRAPSTTAERRANFRGAVSIRFRVAPPLTRLFDADSDGVDAIVFDADAPERGSLFRSGGPPVDAAAIARLSKDPWALARRVPFAGRSWIILTLPTPAYRQIAASSAYPLMILTGGAALTALAAGLAWSHMARLAAAQRFAHEQERLATRLREANGRLERHVIERTEALADRTSQLQRATIELTHAEQRERQRVARILHDHHQQLLVAIKLRLGPLTRPGEPHADTVGRALALVDEAIANARSLSCELAAATLQTGGIADALAVLAERIRESCDLIVHLGTADAPEPADARIRVLLFEIARELLLNIVKHADTSEAWVTLHPAVNDQIELLVEDRGQGLPETPRQRAGASTGLGLTGMADRVHALGGAFDLRSSSGAGTTVTIRLPLTITTASALR